MKAIKTYIRFLIPVIANASRGTILSQQERVRIKILNSIVRHLVNITRWSHTYHAPYMHLCKEGQAFGGNGHDFGCEEIITNWAGLRHVIDNLGSPRDV